jgi:hypothetical protein
MAGIQTSEVEAKPLIVNLGPLNFVFDLQGINNF